MNIHPDFLIFPFYHRPVTEDHHERQVEKLINRADTLLKSGQIPQADYDAYYDAIRSWERGLISANGTYQSRLAA